MSPALLILLAIVGGCAAPLPETELPVTVSDLWAFAVDPGAVALPSVVVTSPRTALGGSFWVQDPGGGLATGLRVDVIGFQEGVPPEIGTSVTLTGAWSADLAGVPSLEIDNDTDVVIGSAGQAVVALAWTGDPAETGSPVTLGDRVVSSAVDPLGDALLEGGVQIRGAFGTFPGGWDERATVSGIAVGLGEVAPRFAEDWVVLAPARAPEVVALTDLGALAEGTPVVVEGLTQAAPWSDDGRWTAVQSGDAGLWIDAEGWDVVRPEEGDVATWEGEVRRGADGVRLRVWLDPRVTGVDDVATGEVVAEGARVTLPVSGIGPPDAYGARPTAEGLPLDDRFTAIDLIPDPAVATGIVRQGPDGALQLAPFAWE